MTISVLELKERRLAEINSLKQWMSERTSGKFILMLASILAANQDDPLAAPPHKKSPTTRGGREKLATEKQRFYMIGCLVDQMFPRFESAFSFLKQLKVINRNSDLNTYRTELSKLKLTHDEIDSVLQAGTPRGAAKRFVAKTLRISLSTVSSCYSRYKASKSKRRSASTIP
jgi:hypothetical protein